MAGRRGLTDEAMQEMMNITIELDDCSTMFHENEFDMLSHAIPPASPAIINFNKFDFN